jgi:cell division septum initiation protein DivIVA
MPSAFNAKENPMNEQELREENERLRRQVAELTKSRERLLDWLCQALRFETDPEVLEKEMEEMLRQPGRDAFDLLREVLPADLQYLVNGNEKTEPQAKLPASV